MSYAEKRQKWIQQLQIELALLDKSVFTLQYSYEKCRKIVAHKTDFDIEELESLEALTARFARTADILQSKVLKTLFLLLQENLQTFFDKANLLERLEIVDKADDLLSIREIRNTIAHDYVILDVSSLFIAVLDSSPVFFTTI
jgi:hypothetical protein